MNGLKHFVPGNVKPKFQIVEVFIKVRHGAISYIKLYEILEVILTLM